MALRKDVLEDDDRFSNQVSKVRNWLVERDEAEDDGRWLPPKARAIPQKKKRRQSPSLARQQVA